MTRPRLVHDEERRAVPTVLRFVGAVGNISDFLYLQNDSATDVRRVPRWIRFLNPAFKALLPPACRWIPICSSRARSEERAAALDTRGGGRDRRAPLAGQPVE